MKFIKSSYNTNQLINLDRVDFITKINLNNIVFSQFIIEFTLREEKIHWKYDTKEIRDAEYEKISDFSTEKIRTIDE